MDTKTHRRINSLETQIAQTREAIDTLAECGCRSNDKQFQAWAFGYAMARPQVASRIDRLVSRHS
ncbi:MAG: hypothetical protein FD138_4089 [Planctomycetota bacterium]|nr:MAG: hypothetical protein FD138_4089 [Planctomycetota bacterium]